jgi:hypothetical protein
MPTQPGEGCKICLTEPTHTNRCTSECLHDVRLKLFSRSSLLLLAVVLLLQAQGLCNTWIQPGTSCKFYLSEPTDHQKHVDVD